MPLDTCLLMRMWHILRGCAILGLRPYWKPKNVTHSQEVEAGTYGRFDDSGDALLCVEGGEGNQELRQSNQSILASNRVWEVSGKGIAPSKVHQEPGRNQKQITCAFPLETRVLRLVAKRQA